MKKQLNQQERSEVIFMFIIILMFILTGFISKLANQTTLDPEIKVEHVIQIPTLAIKYIPDLPPEDVESVDYVVVMARVTAYAPFDNQSGICADENPNVTSRGYKPSSKYIAVDPSRIAYGTEVEIPGYGLTVAGDTGGALRSYNGYAIDVFMDTYAEAIDWGVQYLEVKVYD